MSKVKTRKLDQEVECPMCSHTASMSVVSSWDTVLPNGQIRCTDYVVCLDCGFTFYFGWTENEDDQSPVFNVVDTKNIPF
jgi:transcription elongation factor Elf1